MEKTKNNKPPGENSVVDDAIKIGGNYLLKKIRDMFNLRTFYSAIPD